MEPIEFRYHLVNEQGQETGFFASKGEVNEAELVLDKVVIPLVCIYQVVQRQNRLVFVYAGEQAVVTTALAVKGGEERRIKEAIDRLCSKRWARQRRDELAKEGNEGEFRTAKCRACSSFVDLTGFAETPQFYCPFCETLVSADFDDEAGFQKFHLCDQCRFYSRPATFTSVYFVFLFVAYYWSTRSITCCHACMRKESWKMLFGNLLFVFGVPFAIFQLIRAYTAAKMSTTLPQLDSANHAGQKGKVETAERLYAEMLESEPVNAGIRYNLAHTYALAERWEDCLAEARDALKDASNYQPAGDLVVQALKALGKEEKADQFTQRWGQPRRKGGPPPLPEPPREPGEGFRPDRRR